MRTHLACFPCFLRQSLIALGQQAGREDTHEKIVKEVISLMRDADTRKPPAYTTTLIHRLIRERLGRDPFSEIKSRYNNIAMGLYPQLKERVAASEDPLWTASRLAIAGNVIDFGIFTSIDIEGSIKKALAPDIAADDYLAFRASLDETGEVLYLLDNAGEIVFDRLLIEELVSAGKTVKAAVKGSPVLNDVTSVDAFQVNLDGICQVIDNGSDAVGTIIELTSPEFQEEFRRAEFIVSKGQGNFETLVAGGKKTYFLFQSKCEVVSHTLGLSPGSMLLKEF